MANVNDMVVSADAPQAEVTQAPIPTTLDQPVQPTPSAPEPQAPQAQEATQGSATAPANSVAPSRTNGVHGVLSGIVMGALAGAAHGLQKTGSTFKRGMTNLANNSPVAQKLQDENLARAKTRQEMQLAQQKAQQEQLKSEDEHTAAGDKHAQDAVVTNGLSLDNAHKVVENGHLESLYPGLEQEQRNTLLDQTRAQNAADLDFASTLESIGIHLDTTNGPGHANLTPTHAQDVASGKQTMLSNGKTGDDAGYAFVSSQELQNSVLPSDVKVATDWNLDPKTGKINPVYSTLKAGQNTAWDALIGHNAGMKKFNELQAQEVSKATLASEQAKAAEAKAAAAKDYGEANKANAEAKLAQGGVTDTNKMLTGDAFIATLPPAMQDQVRGVIKYKVDPAVFGRQGAQRTAITTAAMHADPTWSEPEYKERYNYLQEYGSSTKGDGATRNRLNTAIGHLDLLSQAGDALAQNNIPKLNELANAIGVATGSSAAPVYDAIAEKAGGEIAGAVKGGGNAATDPALEKAAEHLNHNMSHDARKGVMQAQAQILQTMAGTITGKFQQLMKQSPDAFGQPVLYGGNAEKLQRLASGGPPVGAVPIIVNGQTIGYSTDGGKTYTPSH